MWESGTKQKQNPMMSFRRKLLRPISDVFSMAAYDVDPYRNQRKLKRSYRNVPEG